MSDPTWITIFQGGSGTGDGEILYIVSPYVGDGEARTGTITVGDKEVYISQRPYDLSIDPSGTWVEGNNGAGEFGVAAGIGDIWTAIVTEPWITLVEGYDKGTGSGIVRFLYTANDTGETRTGKIIVAGEVFTVQQRARKIDDIFPAVSDDSGIAAALQGSADPRLAEKITTVEAYDAFRSWIEENDLDRRAVQDSPHAWPSFLLGSKVLFENEPIIRIDGIAFGDSEAKSANSVPPLEIRVAVKDGATAAPVDAAKVAALFAATGNPSDWEAAPLPVEILQSGRDGDSLLFQVTPGTGTEPAIFLRLSD